MNKKKYEKAEMEITVFECEDIITGSEGSEESEDPTPTDGRIEM